MKTKILYVDDEPINRQLFSALIEKENFEVLLANGAIEALEILDNNPDTNLIFSDMQMPLVNGIEFIQKAREKYPDKKYALLTCMDKTHDIQHAIDSKLIFKYLKKPISNKLIVTTINEMLNKSKDI